MTVRTLTLLAAGLALGGPLAAQSAQPDPRWLPWLGCWQPAADAEAEAADSAGTAQPPTVCVTPTSSPDAVEMVTVTGGTAASRERIQAGGQQRARADEGCSGWERAEWSADGRRLFRRTEHSCPGGIQRQSSGLMAVLPTGEWIDAQGVSIGGDPDVRVLRYQPAPASTALPAAVTRSLGGRTLAVDAARSAAAAAPGTRDLVEASRHVDPSVVGAWLIERGQGFDVSAERLVELADAGVPESVIDLMVALSYPEVFAIDLAAQEGEFRPGERSTARTPRRPVHYPWGYYPGYGYGYYPRYGYYGRYYGRPVVVVRNPSSGRAKAVKGRGYTRRSGDSSAGTSTSSRPNTSKAGSGSSRSDEGRSRSGSGSTRTAKPRPNTN